jgi:hypothetical protein
MWQPLSGRRRHRILQQMRQAQAHNVEHLVPLHHVHPRVAATMEEFTEGRLDCTVNSPQKENAGTKDVYISYLVTTNVWRIVRELGSSTLSLHSTKLTRHRSSPTTHPLTNPHSAPVAVSPTSFSSTAPSSASTPPSQYPQYPTNISSNMCEATGSGPTLRRGGHIACTAS